MFWSGTLLNATGPLAKAWLSANMERKLSKTHILQHNLQDSVDAIITPNQAPMALRLSGQLLLGVVRIYGRKARYLLDDCNEALVKIKMAFRSSGNHDIPANLAVQNKEALMLPDRITPYDNLDLLPPPDASWLSSQIEDVTSTPSGRKGRVSNRDINLQEDFNNSQFLNDDLLGKEDEHALGSMDDLELDLDFGMDLDEAPTRIGNTTIEMGRDAPAARPVEDDMFSELDMQGPNKDRAAREPSLGLDLDFGDGIRIHDEDGDVPMVDDDFNFDIGEPSVNPAAVAAVPDPRARISESPLSDVDEEFAREVELEYSRHLNQDMYEPHDDSTATVVAPQRRVKKTKLLQPDEQTMLSSAHIKEQQAHRENILKPQCTLSKDPFVVSLMGMQKSGEFINSILRGTRSATWAPELRNLLSITAIRPEAAAAADRKRKRDSGIADMDSEAEQGRSPKSPRLDIPDEDTVLAPGAAGLGNNSLAEDGTMHDIPAQDDDQILHLGDDDDDAMHQSREGQQNFDETSAPLVHPADSGPVSIATKHAVHILRDIFGPEAEHDADKRKKASVVFQDLLPEQRTSKADATKMFFECLVLATKDAIKVEQPEGSLGGPIRVRGKRGLWGTWAEREAGGEIASQSQEQEQQQGNGEAPSGQRNEPESAVQSSRGVAVEA
ncbi:Rec8 like protein-domain-containing protein [Coniochaeta sp. 2T2.1]|nr:Rec8 like protein-domain-containing protein [Coniochaeta sp. 2T2.1]